MEALDAHGDASAALAIAADHATVVARELETAPAARIIALERQIRQRSAIQSADAVLHEPPEDQPETSRVAAGGPPHSHLAIHGRWSTRRLAVALAAAALGILALQALRRRTALTAAGATVAIFPFAIAPEDSALLPLRERIADLLALRLQGETAPRPLDAAALRRSLGDQWNVVSPAQDAALLAAARFHDATMLIVGDVIGSAASLTVHARVRRVSDGREVASTEVTGPLDSLPTLVDQLAGEIGVIATGVPGWRLSDLRAHSPAALRAYTDGRRLLRAGRLDEAAAAFRAALDIDSTFASAALGIAEAGASPA